MKRLFFLSIVLLFSTALLCQSKKTVVIEATMATDVDISIKELFMSALQAGLSNSNQFIVIANRNEYAEKIRGEIEAMEGGLIDDKQWITLGQASGAEMVIYVHIVGVDQQYFITVSLIELESGISKKTLEPILTTRSDIMQTALDFAKRIADGGLSSDEKIVELTDMACHAFPGWQIDNSSHEETNWNSAFQACEKKGPGWRLPTSDELRVICEDAHCNPSAYGTPWRMGTYWTLSKRNNFSVYTIDFIDCSITYESMTSTAYFRCVRQY